MSRDDGITQPVQGGAPDLDAWLGCVVGTAPNNPVGLRRWQLDRAWQVVERVAAGNPFYRNRLRLPSARDAAAFRELSVTTKDDVVADCTAHPPYGSRTVCEPAASRQVVETSGTSGRGTEVYLLDEQDEAAVALAEAVGFSWVGVQPGWRVLLTFPIATSAAGQWYYAGLRLLGANVLAVGSYPVERKLEVLQRYGADLVIATPSYLDRLAHACERANMDPHKLGVRSLLVGGEPFSKSWAAKTATRWGAPVFEQYGCTERVFAWACPESAKRSDGPDVLHFTADNAYVEVIDPDSGSPVADGQEGEVIVTPLHADASPLVRFATRDKVQYRAPGSCACGRPLAGITAGRVQRYDDMMKIRAMNLWPRSIDAVVLDLPGVVEYRAVVRRGEGGDERIEFVIEPASDAIDPHHLVDEVVAVVQRSCGLRISAVELTDPGAISGSIPEGFVKVSRWTDRRNLAT
ncbi:phenylacetate--CoA ligase family protein [Nocardia gipuzkoensis]|uniref:phenylacetate--CoA ligase family protein n=1 Tax=Nocardia gipuzkoensis TaxID=2749991 RepID=UPI00237D8EB6|nr:AMP-binding protein [Nocardia gipuzkoensis]MDE1674873.1 AMP-binding protein [Nocardia gipuzkoensis]